MVARELKRGLKITGELSEQAGLVPCRLPRGCGEIGIHAVFRWRWANARGGSSPLSRTPVLVASLRSGCSLPLSSRGLGRRPLTAETGVRIPVAVLHDARLPGGFRRF